MKRPILALMLAFVLVIGCACSKTESADTGGTGEASVTAGFKEYTNGEISMLYPEDFVVSEEVYSDGDLFEIFYGSSPDGVGGSFSITYVDMPGISLSDLTEDVLMGEEAEDIEAALGAENAALDNKKFEKTDDRITYSYTMTCDFMEQQMKVEYFKIMVQRGERFYTVVFSNMPDECELSLEEQFAVSIESFKVVG